MYNYPQNMNGTYNNCQCNVCSSPVTIQVLNSTAVTFTNVNITVDKVA